MGRPLKQGNIDGSRTEIPFESQHKAALIKIDCPDCNYAKKIALE